MADNSSDITESPGGNYFPQDFSLENVRIDTDFGQKIDIRSLVIELSFFEDLYSFVTSGYVIVKDALGLVEKLKLDGNEFIKIVYGKTKNQKDAKLDRTFRLYKATRKPIGNMNSEYVTFYFCNEILMLSEQIKISKGYSGKKIATKNSTDGIINNILLEKLKVKPEKLVDIEETYGTYDFVVPKLKPLEAISWLSTYARPTGNKIGADMLFFETKDGFSFRSLQSLLKDSPYATYKYQPKNLDFNKSSFQEGVISVLDYEIIKSFDSLENTNSGTYANRLISIDPLTRTYRVTNFNYDKYAKNTVDKDGNPVVSTSTNALGIKQSEAYDARLKMAFSNSNQTDIEYIKKNQGSTGKNIFIETYVPHRTAQLSLANYILLKIVVPGDSDLTVGRTINFNLYSLQNEENRKLDDYFSGKYLVTAARHVIQTNGSYQTILEIAKETVGTPYVKPDNTSASYREDVNG